MVVLVSPPQGANNLHQYAEQLGLIEAQKAEIEGELARRAWDVPQARHLVGWGPLKRSGQIVRRLF